MTTAARVLDVARSQIGIRENPPYSNDVPYSRWMGMVGQPWCDMFVSWCFHTAGLGAVEGRWAYTPAHANNFAARHRWHPGTAGAQPGDVVFFDFPGPPYRISHVGFVESIHPSGGIVTIEGNTNAAGSRDGGSVMRHTRTSSIVGYGRPAYDQGDLPAMPLSATDIDAIALMVLRYDAEVVRPREQRTRRLLKATAVAAGLTPGQVAAALDGAGQLGALLDDIDDDREADQAQLLASIVATIDDHQEGT